LTDGNTPIKFLPCRFNGLIAAQANQYFDRAGRAGELLNLGNHPIPILTMGNAVTRVRQVFIVPNSITHFRELARPVLFFCQDLS
jgi:hypothetical protein